MALRRLPGAKLCLLVSLLAPLLVFIAGPSLASAATGTSGTASNPADTSSTPYAATGYFYVTKKGNGWTLVTPQGEPFYASGIDTVSPGGSGTDQKTGVCPYCVTVANDFPSTAAWAASTVTQLRSWGFNSLGAYSDDADLRSQMPYEVQLSMASGDDWFAPSFVTNADNVAATQVAPLADDPNVIGYFTDSELDWGPLTGDGVGTFDSVLTQYLQLPAGSPGLAVAQQYEGNPEGFLTALATRYFSVTTAAIHMYDTNHLILGVKAEGQEIEAALIKAAAPYVNVFSLEDYVLPPGADQVITGEIWKYYLPQEQNLADLEAAANIPLMIGEYSFASRVNTTGDPDTVPAVYEVAQTQQQRASFYENFIAPLYEATPALVGDDWFQYVDEPANGRVGDAENYDFGMIDVNGNPYPTMVSAMQLMHNVVADLTGDNGPVCDSWATSNSALTCTATMPSSTQSPLAFVSTTMPPGIVGQDYFFGGVYAAGGTPDYSYALTQGSLPAGLTLDPASGIISGTPTTQEISSFTVQATDSGGSQVSQAFSIDIGSPGSPSVTTKSLPNAVPNQQYSDTLAASGATPPYTWSLSAGALPTGLTLSPNGVISGVPTVSGTFPITVGITDSGSPALSGSANLTLNVPPATSVLVPSTNATLQGTATLDAGASSQNAIASVRFEVSGGSISNRVVGTGIFTAFGWIDQWNTTTVPNGTYELQSLVTDNQGITGTSAPVTITVNNAAPTTSVVGLSSGAIQSGGSAVLDATASTNVTSVSYELSGGGFNDQPISGATLTFYGWVGYWNTTTVPNGTYTIQSVASYTSGQSGTSAPVTITVNNTAPTTSVVAPTSGATQSGGAAVLDATTSANVTSVSYELSGGAFNDQPISRSAPSIYGWVGRWDTTTVPNGTYTIQSVASYTSGQSGTSAPITITVNNPPPTTSVLAPTSGATQSGGAAVLDATTSANVTSVSYELSGGAFNDQPISGSAPSIYGWVGQWNTTTVPNGTYTIQSVASYANGESGTSAPITITVNNGA